MATPGAAKLAVTSPEATDSRNPVVVERRETIPELIADMSRLYKTDSNLALRIAKCESGVAQYNKDGSLVRGKVVSADVGVFQVNETYHLEQSKKLGFDIHTPEGNVGYAIWLLKNEGSKHWNSSRKCWSAEESAT